MGVQSVREGDQADVFGRLMPLLNSTFEPGTCQAAIDRFEDPSMRAVARAEYCYFSGQAEEAACITSDLLEHPDPAVRLSACLIYAYANLPLGNINSARFALAKLRNALEKSPTASSAQGQTAMAFMGYTSSVLLHLPLPEEAPAAAPTGSARVRAVRGGASAVPERRACAQPRDRRGRPVHDA